MDRIKRFFFRRDYSFAHMIVMIGWIGSPVPIYFQLPAIVAMFILIEINFPKENYDAL